MMRRLARPFAIAGLVATLVGAVIAVALRIVDPVPMAANSFGFGDASLLGFEFFGIAFAAVGALLVVRRPTNAVGWCMVLIGASHALAGCTAAVTSAALADGTMALGTAQMAGWLSVLFVMTGSFLLIGLGLIFPTGRGHTVFWDRLIRLAAIVAPVIVITLFLLRPGPLQLWAAIDNPFGVGPDVRSVLGAQPSEILAASTLLIAPLLGLSIASRYRMSDGVGQQQLKWFVLALLVSVAGITLAAVGALLGRQAPETGLVVFGFAGALIPIAIGIAILRYRLYDIDRIVSRTIGYAAITGVLAVVFAGVILLVAGLLTSFSQGLFPSAQGQSIAVAVSTVVVFALFQPVRRLVQRAVDRRFDRARYDGQSTIASFAGRLRDDVDLGSVSDEITRTAISAVHPAGIALWLRAPGADDRNGREPGARPVTIPGRAMPRMRST